MAAKTTTEEKKLDKVLLEVEEFIKSNRTPKPNIGLQIIKMNGMVTNARETVTSLELSLQSMKPDVKTQQLKSKLTQYNIKCNKYEKQLSEIQAKSVLADDSDEDGQGVESLLNFEDSDDEQSGLIGDKSSNVIDKALKKGRETEALARQANVNLRI